LTKLLTIVSYNRCKHNFYKPHWLTTHRNWSPTLSPKNYQTYVSLSIVTIWTQYMDLDYKHISMDICFKHTCICLYKQTIFHIVWTFELLNLWINIYIYIYNLPKLWKFIGSYEEYIYILILYGVFGVSLLKLSQHLQ